MEVYIQFSWRLSWGQSNHFSVVQHPSTLVTSWAHLSLDYGVQGNRFSSTLMGTVIMRTIINMALVFFHIILPFPFPTSSLCSWNHELLFHLESQVLFGSLWSFIHLQVIFSKGSPLSLFSTGKTWHMQRLHLLFSPEVFHTYVLRELHTNRNPIQK